MDGVVSLAPKPADDLDTHSHVREEAQVLGGENFFSCWPGGVLKGLPNILGLKVRMTLENLLDRCPMSNLPYDDGDWNSHSSNACTASRDLRVERNAIEVHATSLAGQTVPRGAAAVRALLLLRE
jgi:hypothetical protein